MILPLFRHLLLRYSLILSLLLLVGCTKEKVVFLTPMEGDLVTVNGCVISACNYLALVQAKHKLDENFWSKILLVRYDNHPAGHAYCVWETEGTIYGYDRNSGGFPIPVYTRDPRAIAIVLAQELSRIMKEPLTVSNAEFVEPGKVPVYKYSMSVESPAPVPLTTSAPIRGAELSLALPVRPRPNEW